jgi:hypothetical protein
MTEPPDRWAEANAALLAARGLEALPADEARALVALLHVGTLVEPDDRAALAALDLERLRLSRALAAGTLEGPVAEAAAVRLLALGHREPARRLLPGGAALRAAWRAWTGEGDGDPGASDVGLEAGGVRLVPDAAADTLALAVPARAPGRLAVRRLRVGGTTLDLGVRWRAGAIVLRAERTHGPPLVLAAAFPADASLMADDVPLVGPRARLELRDRHEVVAYA